LEAAKFLDQRIFELYKKFDDQLAKNEFIAGDHYSIADIAIFPTINDEALLVSYANLKRWHIQVGKRAAVQRGMAIPE